MDDPQNPGPQSEEPLTAYPSGAPAAGRRSFKTWVLVGAGTAALVVAGAGISAAAGSGGQPGQAPTTQSPTTEPGPEGMHRGPGVGGTIASVDGSNLTVTDRSGATVTVTTAADTKVTRATKGAVGDVAVGDNVVAMGPTTGTDVTAKAIIDTRANQLPPRPDKGDDHPDRPHPADRPEPVAGQVTGIDGATITVQGASATYRVTTSADTRVMLVETIAVSDLKVGDHVHVMGQKSGTSIAAMHIRVGDPEADGHGPGMEGPGMDGPGMPGPGMHGRGPHPHGPDGDQDDSGTDSSGSSGTSSPTTL